MKSFKKIALAAVGASLLAAPAAFAAPYQGWNNHYAKPAPQRVVTRTVTTTRYVQPTRYIQPIRYVQPRRWARGQRFDYRQARNFRVVSNPYAYRLNAAPRGYRWVQSDHDAVMVGITTGLIASVIANAFH